MTGRCDVAGCEEAPALYGPSGRRCMAHVPREAPLRSDVPPLRRARIRLAFAEIARAEAVRAGKRLAEGRATDAELRDRVTTICDEALGLQPVQSAEDSLTMIEQHLHELRREPDEAQALIARDGWINVENQHGLLGGVRYLLHHAAALREDRDAAQNELRAYESDQDAAVQHVLDERDAARAMFDAARARLAEVERMLAQWPWDGAAALRVLRGEPLVRERT